LNQTESALIASLIPRQQALLKRPDLAKVINLRVDPKSARIYTPGPADGDIDPAGRRSPDLATKENLR
jgi:hypothetical protein